MRRNNLIPAKIGVYTIFVLILFILLDAFAYSISAVNVEKRVFFIAFSNDVLYAIVAPVMALYGMPGVMGNIRNNLMGERNYGDFKQSIQWTPEWISSLWYFSVFSIQTGQ